MLDVIADLHLHSRYSRAVSPQMVLPEMNRVAIQKGIDILTTGDWTHPIWMREIKSQLEEAEEGLYKLKSQIPSTKSQINSNDQNSNVIPAKAGIQENIGSRIKSGMTRETRFLLSVEIANIYSQGGKGRRIHNVVFVPSFETAEKVNKELVKRGFNITSDGRPIIGLSSKNLLELLLEIDERSLLIPAHIWTPWFGIYGQMSGFENLNDAFGDMDKYIYGIETGLSSDPEMNWQIEELNTKSILSFSDAHSPAKMGREATVFRLESLSYENIRSAIMQPMANSLWRIANGEKTINHDTSTINKVLYTIEFYPEEGKYHYSGHRNCGVTMTPEEQRTTNGVCPVCKRKVTDGVMRRVQELSQEDLPAGRQVQYGIHKANTNGLVWIKDPKNIHPPFVKIVPLNEIIAEALGTPVASPKVKVLFDGMCKNGRSEFDILLKVPLEEVEKAALQYTSLENAAKVKEGIQKVREEHIVIQPGYDGVYGVVKIWNDEKDKGVGNDEKAKKEQIGLEF